MLHADRHAPPVDPRLVNSMGMPPEVGMISGHIGAASFDTMRGFIGDRELHGSAKITRRRMRGLDLFPDEPPKNRLFSAGPPPVSETVRRFLSRLRNADCRRLAFLRRLRPPDRLAP